MVRYGWKVVSRSEASAEETESNTRYFFLEAQQQLAHLPFPAKLISPQENGELNNGNVVFSWEGADLDGDVSSYNLLLGSTETSLETIASGLTQSSYSHALEIGNQYYWQVETIDRER